jgi:hypothetical protein
MAIVFADKVKVRSYSTGTAEFTLETAVPGFQSFAAIGAGNECYYGIEDAAGNWEVGRGTYDTDSTQELLFRDTVISSSNSNNKVNFPAGGKSVFVTIPSSVAASIIASAASDSFSTIAVAGQSNVVADGTTDTLTLVAGNNIDIATNATTDTITINNNLTSISQNVLPSVDSDGTTGYTLGSPSFKWKELFVSNGSIYIGDVKLSNVAGKLVALKVINPGEDDEEEDPDDSDATSEIGGGGANLRDILVDSPANMFDDGSGNFVNFNVNEEEWMRLGTLGNEKLQLITNYANEGGNVWEFGTNGNLKLPSGGDIVDSTGASVLGGLTIITPEDFEVQGVRTLAFAGAGVSVDRINDIPTVTIEGGGGGDNSYTPEEPDHWNSPTVNTVQAALDELAAKMAALENFEIDGGNAYTPAAGELLIDGNGA